METRGSRHHSRAFRLLVTAPCILLAAYFILWACAPPAAFPPPVPMARDQAGTQQKDELGFGATAALGNHNTFDGYVASSGVNVQAWYYYQFADRFDLGVNTFAGQTSLAGAGLLMRYHFVRLGDYGQPKFRLAGEIQAGWLYLQLGVPMALKLREDVWFTFSPSFGYRAYAPLRLPIGFSFRTSPKTFLHTEIGVGSGRLEGFQSGFFDDRFIYGGIAVGRRF